jgi:hypothetical protein
MYHCETYAFNSHYCIATEPCLDFVTLQRWKIEGSFLNSPSSVSVSRDYT